MKIIEKIEIKNFRSFGDSEKTKIYDLNDLNIFSGANDSGKSNILRALNLFFHLDKIDFYQRFVFEKDFSRAHEERLRGQQKGKSFVEISILFAPTNEQFNTAILPSKFWITKGFYDDPTLNFTKIRNEKRKELKRTSERKALTRFLKKINFQYVPAIKDKTFFDFLKEKYQEAIGKTEVKFSETDKKTIKDWVSLMSSLNVTKILDEKIKEESRDLFSDFAKRTAEIKTANFNIPYLEINYSEAIDVETDEGISLRSRGDGVQAKFIPVILDEIAKRNIKKPIVIWAFEEPENSYEYKNAQKLADDFLNEYSKTNQIFITTHSFNFLSLRGPSASTFRVYKEEIDVKGRESFKSKHQVSRVLYLPENISGKQACLDATKQNNREYLEEELGIYELNKELALLYQEKQKEKEEHISKRIEYEALLTARPSKIFICEDSAQDVQNLWGTLLAMFEIVDVRVMTSQGSTGNLVENGVRHQQKLDPTYNPKIFRQIDRDGLTDNQINLIKEKVFRNEKKDLLYQFAYLPVNEIENFFVINDPTNFGEEFWSANEKIVVDKFQLTAESNCKKFAKNFDADTESSSIAQFRNSNGTFGEIFQKMRDVAQPKWQMYFPGKDICAQVSNCNPISRLSSLTKEELPLELSNYLLLVKNFYEK